MPFQTRRQASKRDKGEGSGDGRETARWKTKRMWQMNPRLSDRRLRQLLKALGEPVQAPEGKKARRSVACLAGKAVVFNGEGGGEGSSVVAICKRTNADGELDAGGGSGGGGLLCCCRRLL